MKVSCPECGASFGLQASMNDANARRFARLMGEIQPELAPVIIEYITLFRPAKRGLSWQRAHAIATSLMDLINQGVVRRNHDQYGATPQMWRAAMRQMIDRADQLSLPLKTHGYLQEIVLDIARQKHRRDAIEEQEREAQRRHRHRDGARPAEGEIDRQSALKHLEKLKFMTQPETEE